jgi:hypothetical protein
LTPDEIKRWFRRFTYDQEFRDENGSRTVPMRTLCRFAGISRQDVYQIMRGEIGLTVNSDNRITYAIECVQKGLRFRRIRQVYTPGYFAADPGNTTQRVFIPDHAFMPSLPQYERARAA